MGMIIAGLIAVLGMAAAADAGDAPAAWRYVVPPPGDSFESPPLRSIGLVDREARGCHCESEVSR